MLFGRRPFEKNRTLDFSLFTFNLHFLQKSEIWGFGKNDIIKRVHLKFCKLLLRLKVSTPNFMVYGELGRYPLEIDIKVRMSSYWCKLIQGKQSFFRYTILQSPYIRHTTVI
jgi:hypothetical protein